MLTRKIIQISMAAYQGAGVTALCDDSSVWTIKLGETTWERLPNIPLDFTGEGIDRSKHSAEKSFEEALKNTPVDIFKFITNEIKRLSFKGYQPREIFISAENYAILRDYFRQQGHYLDEITPIKYMDVFVKPETD